MYYILTPIIFILGASLGSFINVLAERTARNETLKGRSHCEDCGEKLTFQDLIPVISYLKTKGRCRFCKAPLSKQYIAVELLCGALFTAMYILVTSNQFTKADYMNVSMHILDFGPIVPLLFYFIVAVPLVALFITDFKYGMLYDKILIPTIIFVLVYKVSVILYYLITFYLKLNTTPFGKELLNAGLLTSRANLSINAFLQTIAASIGIGLFFLILITITKGRGMGGGDLKLGFLIGLLTGWPNVLISLFLGFLTGACFSIILLLVKRKGLKNTVPFGPFLILACFVVMFFGNQIFNWYSVDVLGIIK